MFAENEHLALMEQDRPIIDAWRGRLIVGQSLGADARRQVLNFLIETPESCVRQAEVGEHGRDQTYLDLIVEGRTDDEAIDRFVTASVDGMMTAGIEPADVQFSAMHLAWLRELQAGSKPLNSEDYDVTLDARLSLGGLTDMYEERDALPVEV